MYVAVNVVNQIYFKEKTLGPIQSKLKSGYGRIKKIQTNVG